MSVNSSSSSEHLPRSLIRAYQGPGIFVTGTGTDIGKTTATTSLAAAFRSLHIRVGVCKPVASGCPKFPDRGNDPAEFSNDDLQSPDAVMAARAAGLDPSDETLLRFLSPLRYAAPVSPALAAQIEQRPPDWHRVTAAFDFWQENCDLLLVEGAGGWYVPLDGPPHDFMIADLAAALRLPVVVVTDAKLGSINQTLLTVHAIREKNLPVVGLIVNRVPDARHRDMALESNLVELPRLAGVPVRGMLPDMGDRVMNDLPAEFGAALAPFAREWWQMVNSAGA